VIPKPAKTLLTLAIITLESLMTSTMVRNRRHADCSLAEINPLLQTSINGRHGNARSPDRTIMKRLLLLVTVSLLLAMWILSVWELAQAAAAAPAPTARVTTFRLANLDGNHRIMTRELWRSRSPIGFDTNRLTFDQNERQPAGTPILADPLELRRLLR
jgi:hypothetical protein